MMQLPILTYGQCFFLGKCLIRHEQLYRCMNLPKTDDNDRTHKNDATTLS